MLLRGSEHLRRWLLRFLQILEKIDGIGCNEAANCAARVDGYGNCPVRPKHKSGCLQVEWIFIDGGSNHLCRFTSVKALKEGESVFVRFNCLLRLIKVIGRE